MVGATFVSYQGFQKLTHLQKSRKIFLQSSIPSGKFEKAEPKVDVIFLEMAIFQEGFVK